MTAPPDKVHFRLGRAAEAVAAALLRQLGTWSGPVAVVCIGSDRSTGDSYGPLVGTRLVEAAVPAEVFGTLENPIHAGNLAGLLPRLAASPRRVIAVDAALGTSAAVGSISVAGGPLVPGKAVHKVLPPVGDIAVTATVNVGGFMETLVLQSTRLFVVLELARVTAQGISLALARRVALQNSNVSSSRSTTSSGVIPSTLMTGMSRRTLSSPRMSSSSPLTTTASTSSKKLPASESRITS
jgi:putative sporulation protein YyaC